MKRGPMRLVIVVACALGAPAPGAALTSWTATTSTGAPSARSQHSAVWTGAEMVVWGGWTVSALSTGSRYSPLTDAWTPTSTTGAPSGRYRHTALWTGTKMIVWGGFDGFSTYRGDGRIYDPATDAWTAMTGEDAPTGRASHSAVWTGTKMIVWGGAWMEEVVGIVWTGTGGAYDLATDTWSPTPETSAPAPRAGHSAVWTGTKMVVWGGYAGGGSYLASGGVLELGTPLPADLSITKSDGETSVVAGSPIAYTVVASNAGPNPATGAQVIDAIPTTLANVTWACAGAGGGTCAASGSGDISELVDLPPGGTVTYTVAGTLSASASGELSNTAQVAAPLAIVDTNLRNNSATDTDTILPLPDLSIADAPPVPEGDLGTGELQFTVSLSASSTQTVSVSYHTLDGTAEAGSDYTADSGDLTFDPGVTQRTIAVEVLADDRPEPDETVSVKLTSPSGATSCAIEVKGASRTTTRPRATWTATAGPTSSGGKRTVVSADG